MVQTIWFILQCAARWYEHLPITELEIATLAFTMLNLITYAFWWNKLADVRYPHPTVKCSVVDTTSNDSDSGEGEGEVEARNRPRGDPGNQGEFFGNFTPSEDHLIASILACVATLFGAIHCFAWSLQFPSSLRQLLWRVSALTITSAPIIELLDAVVASTFDGSVATVLALVLMFITATAYIAARVTLLVLTFTSLRNLPPGAYEAVYWTTFIPHV
ncbi:hypothetical protein JAAARDRAFT_198241 [Jaapia argillacea MUCL 33604]|uniref:Uncharacterized protein n=1 Tax=Jaapia argillacea MUCL 33604 TaxID=933084 RepID=A0A067PCH6_9AGAM|nr:hypothetical protein JAAARDRAFT_198241 [Jaapia argillacea MUCL 33604]